MIKQGFILVEVLIALAISSMLTMVLFFSVAQVTSGVRSLDDVMNLYSRVIVVTRQLEHDIAGATLVREKVTKIFFSQEKDGNCQLLTFITNNPLVQWQTRALKSRLARVTYRLIPDKAASKGPDKRYILTRQESVELTFDPDSHKTSEGAQPKTRAYELIDGIVSFTTVYTSSEMDETSKGKEITTWDSDSKLDGGKKRESHQMIPKKVTIALQLADSKSIKHDFHFVIPIEPDMTAAKTASTVDTVQTTTRNNGNQS